MVDKKIENLNSSEFVVEQVLTTKKRFYNDANRPAPVVIVSNKPTKVEESPLDARSPQEVLDYHGMYKDPSYYEQNPDKIYMDLTQFDDYESHLKAMRDLKEKFSRLPVDVKARFNHNPSEFFDYVSSDKFELEKVMDYKTAASYKRYKAEEESRRQFEAYQNSPEYKQVLIDMENRAKFAESQYQEWLSKQVSS